MATLQTLKTLRTLRTLRLFTAPLYQFVFPRVCFGCGKSLQDDERKICVACWSSIRRVSESDDVYRETLQRLSADGVVSALAPLYYFDKEGVLQGLIHDLKYGGMTSLAILLGERLGESLMRQMDPATVAGLIPVPLHRTRERERGYNQSGYICKGIQNVTAIPVLPRLLRRTRYTESQARLDIDGRKENVSGAFALRSPSALTGQQFVLVDDVITTGATMRACAWVLRAHGAGSVIACSVALAS